MPLGGNHVLDQSLFLSNDRPRGSILILGDTCVYIFISSASTVGAKHAILWSWTKFPTATARGSTNTVQARRETVPNASSSRGKGMNIYHGLLVRYRLPKTLIFIICTFSLVLVSFICNGISKIFVGEIYNSLIILFVLWLKMLKCTVS